MKFVIKFPTAFRNQFKWLLAFGSLLSELHWLSKSFKTFFEELEAIGKSGKSERVFRELKRKTVDIHISVKNYTIYIS